MTENTTQAAECLSRLTAELDTRPFKVLDASQGCVRFVKWGLLNEETAQKNHRQTLIRLNERGGLCAEEIWANVNRCSQYDCPDLKTAVKLVNSMSA